MLSCSYWRIRVDCFGDCSCRGAVESRLEGNRYCHPSSRSARGYYSLMADGSRTRPEARGQVALVECPDHLDLRPELLGPAPRQRHGAVLVHLALGTTMWPRLKS